MWPAGAYHKWCNADTEELLLGQAEPADGCRWGCYSARLPQTFGVLSPVVAHESDVQRTRREQGESEHSDSPLVVGSGRCPTWA